MPTESFLDASFAVAATVSLLCGGAIGLERQIRGKPAGVRTSVLICFGTTIFIRLGASVEGASGDPARVLGQVIVGVGFLGAGVIMNRDRVVKGLTSAAVIWILAGIGATIGLGQPISAILLTATTLAVLIGMEQLERLYTFLRRGEHDPEWLRRRHRRRETPDDEAD